MLYVLNSPKISKSYNFDHGRSFCRIKFEKYFFIIDIPVINFFFFLFNLIHFKMIVKKQVQKKESKISILTRFLYLQVFLTTGLKIMEESFIHVTRPLSYERQIRTILRDIIVFLVFSKIFNFFFFLMLLHNYNIKSVFCLSLKLLNSSLIKHVFF